MFKADTVSSRPSSRLGGVNTTGMNKLEARKMQMLVNQRKKLEEELLELEDEILNAVRMNSESIPRQTNDNDRKENLSRKPGSKTTRDRDSEFNLTESSHMSVGLRSVAISLHAATRRDATVALRIMLKWRDNVALVTRSYGPTITEEDSLSSS